MTLLDKFDDALEHSTPVRFAFRCEQIADDFAIGFAEWFWINKNNFFKGERDWYLGFNQILEIYKKEKGL